MANIKELLASMIGKINGKLNAPEQAAQPHQQLVTDADGVARWGTGVLIVRVVWNYDGTLTADKTYDEIMKAYASGVPCHCVIGSEFVDESTGKTVFFTDAIYSNCAWVDSYNEETGEDENLVLFTGYDGTGRRLGVLFSKDEIRSVYDMDIPILDPYIRNGFFMWNVYKTKLFRVYINDNGEFHIEEISTSDR